MPYPIACDRVDALVASDTEAAKSARSAAQSGRAFLAECHGLDKTSALCDQALALCEALQRSADALEERSLSIADGYCALVQQMVAHRIKAPVSICVRCDRYLSCENEEWAPSNDDLYGEWAPRRPRDV